MVILLPQGWAASSSALHCRSFTAAAEVGAYDVADDGSYGFGVVWVAGEGAREWRRGHAPCACAWA